MTNTKRKINKILSVFLVITIILSTFSGLIVSAATPNPYYKIADNATLDGWKQFFGSTTTSTQNAGGVWTDKSVFVDGSAFTGLTDAYGDKITPTVKDDSFLVALSAIASNKSIVGYSHIPTDTVLVLDVSSSMGPGYQSHNNDAIAELVAAANAAMTEILSINNNNRVGVVLYWANTTTFLPIDRYTTANKVSGSSDVLKFFETNSSRNEITISNGVKDGNGNNVHSKTQRVQSGTYIQGGLGLAADMFKEKSDANDTIINGDGFQAGTQRKPVVVLMTDGAPSYGTTNYSDPGNSTIGLNGTSTNNFSFLTQITAAAVKKDITSYYNNSGTLFYTLGFKIGNDATARSVLDPQRSTTTLTNYWNTYKSASVGSNVTIGEGRQTVTIRKSGKVDDIVYNDAYYSADTNATLEDAFEKIVQEIIIQSLYRPTLVEKNDANMEGYIEFIDDIGDYMSVQEIEGILIGDKLFTGEKLCENFRADGGELGTVENPNALGDNLVWSVQERLGINSQQEARDLIMQAYTHGQLSYSKVGSDVTFSNYIGWYADKDGNYLGFWCDKHTYKDIPDNAKYINKSYGMLGEIPGEHIASDLMYVSIQVHTEIVPKERFGLNDVDNIMPGHAQLIFRVPASLIPVVNYEIELEGTSYDDAKNITMNINDAEPIRLLFEVGLREDINQYNIEAALGDNNRAADGSYVFYTNQFSNEQFDKNSSEYVNPTDAINTIAYFEPNYENERYYYNELTPVFVKQGSDYVKYSSATQPLADDGNEYFRQINIFELTGNGNEAVHKKVYERISDTALGRVEKSDTNGGWNIKKETIHRVYDEIETLKTANNTGTLNYSYFPTVEHIEGTHYYADAVLGNNGKLVVTPATGISIGKTVDASMEGNTDEYTFNVDIGDASATYSVVRKGADNMFTDTGEKIILNAEGKGTITLVPGETVLIVGIPSGVSYTINEEIPTGANYEVITSSGTSGTIEQNHLSQVKFENAIRQSGNLIIAKHITHPFSTTPANINNHVFKFDAVLSADGTAYPDATVEAYYSTAPGNKFNLNVVNNKIEGIELKGSQSIVIKIKDGWHVEVTEQGDMPAGFTHTDTDVTSSKVVTTDTNVEYVFTNNYDPDDVSANITINASKVLNGRPWNNDEFTFALYRYNKHTAQYEEIVREKIDKSGNFGATLTNALKAEKFTAVGEYHYMVRELVPSNTKGITYDSHYRVFTVVVTDNDTDGKLEINDVVASNAVTVAENSGAYTVNLDQFVNVYKASGIAEVTIEINKTVTTPSGIAYSPEGFEFGVYDNADKLITPIHKTDVDGKTQFTFTYDAVGVDYQNDKVYSYVIKENDTGLGGITYANDIPFTITVKDNLDGTISATTNITNKNGNVSVVNVENIYKTNNISVTLEATKNITGRALEDKEFKFDLYSVDSGSVVLDDVTNDATGKVVFTLPAFENVGTYNYKVYEDEVDANGVVVDKTEHNVEIVVDHDGKGNLTATVNGTAFNGNAINVGTFNNSYSADGAQVTLEATKTLAGRNTALKDKEFKFALAKKDGTVIQSDATNDINGNIVFNTLTFNSVGTYDYFIYENEIDSNGIKVDSKKYAIAITVTDNGSGKLVATVAVDNSTVTGSTASVIEFENNYSATSVDVELEATKTLTGRNTPLKDKEFKFVLAKKDGTVVQSNVTNNADGKIAFSAITFDKVGTYEYVVYEDEADGNGITVDKAHHAVTIVVTDNNEGQLVASVNGAVVNGAVNVAVFNNTYSAASTGVVLEATKELSGRDLRDGEFKFDLYDVDNDKILQDDVVLVAQSKNKGKITFNNITYNKAGTYNYVVYEDEIDQNGITVDTTRYNVTITVTDNNEGQLNAKVSVNNSDVTGSTADTIVFKNTYKAAKVDVTLEATKTLTGRNTALKDKEFKFALKEKDGAILQSDATNNSDGKVVFDALTFDKIGTYEYVVYENEVDANGIKVDNKQYAVAIVVTDNGKGNLVAEVKVDGNAVVGTTKDVISFNNTYKAAEVSVKLTAIKTLTGRNTVLKDKEFKFALARKDGTILQSDATNDSNGTVAFNTLTFDKTGTYEYIVYENEVDGNGITVDKAQHNVTIVVTDNNKGQLVAEVNGTVAGEYANVGIFANVYKAQSVNVTLEATKTLTGRDLRDGEFKFDLYDVDNDKVIQDDVALALCNDGNGKITFAELTFDKTGVYNYVVYEDEIDQKGITVDTTRYNVIVTVTDDNKGQLNAMVKVDNIDVNGSTANAIVFNNAYTAQDAQVVIEATKILNGRDLVDGEFYFALKDVINDVVIQDTAFNTAEGKVVFNPLVFDQVGTYEYVVYENETDGNGVTVDTTEYTVKIVVTDNGEGKLEVQTSVNDVITNSTADAIIFENTYKAAAADVEIEALKILEGRDLAAGEFEFELYIDNQVVATAKNDAEGKIKFEGIAIDSEGEYVFTVKEVIGDAKGISYDEKAYTVTVNAIDNLDGTYKVEYIYADDNGLVEELVFNNKYTPEPTPEPNPEPQPEPKPDTVPEKPTEKQPDSPKTGDSTNLTAWLAVVFISGAIIFVSGKKLRHIDN